jgi:uncharacterized protein (TIGR01777 family)
MPHHEFIKRSHLPFPAAEVFAWHARPGALERLTPPWDSVRVLESTGGIRDGGRVVLLVGPRPFARRWVAEHSGYRQDRSFRDTQVEGPFEHWQHTHTVEPDGPDGAVLEDRIEFEPPFGGPIAAPIVRRMLARRFEYRHRTIADDLAMHRAATVAPMKVAITGSSGLIGAALAASLGTGGHEVTKLVRSGADPAAGRFLWDPSAGTLDQRALEGAGAVVHLAGESVAGRWTAAKKRRILESRVEGTRLLSETLARMESPPRVMVCASAIGFYGKHTDGPVDETHAGGDDFLAGVVRAWEAACEPAREAGVRVVNTRFGVVLTPAGGALKPMLVPFRLGAGGRLGSGRQDFSWVAIDDVVGAVVHALATPDLAGPVNVTAPDPVTNAEFARTLSRVLRRPALLPAPAWAVRAALGEFSQEVLTGARALPRRLLESGYDFRYPQLEPALRHLLGRVHVH